MSYVRYLGPVKSAAVTETILCEKLAGSLLLKTQKWPRKQFQTLLFL